MPFTYDYPHPAVTVDIIISAKEKEEYFVLLIMRDKPPFEGNWAFPGGFIDMDETPEEAALRELEEETSVTGISLKQFHTYGAIKRDPRQRTISIVYTGIAPSKEINIHAGDDARKVEWFNIKQLPPLAFDHKEILQQLIEEIPLL